MTKVLNNIGQMYKVFFNDRTVFINSAAPSDAPEEAVLMQVVAHADALKARELMIKSDGPQLLYLYGLPASDLLALFSSAFKCITAAGGLPVNTAGELLCIRRWGLWDLPKGKLEKGETVAQAACREVEEETGLKGFSLEKQLDSSFHVYESPYVPGQWIFKTTCWFLMYYEGKEQPVPQSEEDISEVRWFRRHELSEVQQNTYASLQPLFAFYLKLQL
jgi:8-oxo-dGTP pyrophosphatase MutT (NUDIX family)